MRRFSGLLIFLGGIGLTFYEFEQMKDGMRGYIDASTRAIYSGSLWDYAMREIEDEKVQESKHLMVVGVIVSIAGFITLLIPRTKVGYKEAEIEQRVLAANDLIDGKAIDEIVEHKWGVSEIIEALYQGKTKKNSSQFQHAFMVLPGSKGAQTTKTKTGQILSFPETEMFDSQGWARVRAGDSCGILYIYSKVGQSKRRWKFVF